MVKHTTQNVLLTIVFLLALPSKHRPMVVTALENINNHESTSTLTDATAATASSLRRLRQKIVYIPDLFEITPIHDRTLTATSSSEWYDANRGDVASNDEQQKHLPALFNKYRRHLPLSTIHTSAKKYNKENLLFEMEIFERLLQDEYSMSLSMPTQPIAPTPVIITPPTAPTPTIITPPTAPTPVIITPPTAPTPVIITPPAAVVVPTVITTPTTPTVPTPVVVVPSSLPAPQSISPVTAPSTKGKAPNGMMSSSKSSAPSASKGAAPSVPTNVGIPTTPVSKSMVPSSKGGVKAPSSKGGVEAPSSKGGVEAPSSKGGPSSKVQSSPPSSKGMNEPTSKGQPSSPSSKGGAPSTPEPTPLLSSKGGPSTSSPFGSMSGTPSVPGVAPTSSDSTPTAPGATSLPPASTPTASSPTIFEGEGSLAPGGSETSNRGALILSKCGVSESDRSQAILGDASTISALSDLVDETSIAYTALSWLDKEDDLILCSDGTGAVMQRYILAVFYFSLNGLEWTNCRAGTSEVAGSCIDGKPWLDSSLECEWFGIECDANNTVTKLTLKANNLVGVLPDELFFLTNLIGLSLDHNMYIGGEISESIGKLTKLTYVELDENFLGGSIPESLYSISTLQAIDLNGNKLMGTISESIANLPSLAVFQIEDNLFEGVLPIGLASLEELLVLYVHGNNFTGTSLQHICTLMDSRRKTNVAYLQFLTADCKDNGKVECTCCDCF